MRLAPEVFTKKDIRQHMDLTENQLNYLLRKSGIEGTTIGNTKVYSKEQFLELIQWRAAIR